MRISEMRQRLSEEATTGEPEVAHVPPGAAAAALALGVDEEHLRADTIVARQALRMPAGVLSLPQRELVATTTEAAVAGVLSAAERAQLFGPIEKVHAKYGARIHAFLNSGCHEYRKLLWTFATFDAELDEIAETDRTLILYHALKGAELSIRGLFFPSAPPRRLLDAGLSRVLERSWVRIPVAEREKTMKEVLGRFAPSLNTQAFFANNPVLESERSRGGCLAASALLSTILALLLFTAS